MFQYTLSLETDGWTVGGKVWDEFTMEEFTVA